MWCNFRGVGERGASNTFRSPGVAFVIGGGLGPVQTSERPFTSTGARPFIFSSPETLTNAHSRSKSVLKPALKTQIVRPKSAVQAPLASTASTVEGYNHRDLNKSAYVETLAAKDKSRPTSTVPHAIHVPVESVTQTRKLHHTPPRKLMNDYEKYQNWASSNLKPFQKEKEIFRKEAQIHTEAEERAIQDAADKSMRETDFERYRPLDDTFHAPTVEYDFERVHPGAHQPPLVDMQERQVYNIQNTAPINIDRENEIAKLHMPEKLSVAQEIQLRHDIRRQSMRENCLKQKFDIELSNNLKEQQKLREKIVKLQDQQREREFSYSMEEQAKRIYTVRQQMKHEYGKVAKKDLTHFLHRKDETNRAYSKDRTNMLNKINEQQQLVNSQLLLDAYDQHLKRKSQFVSPEAAARLPVDLLERVGQENGFVQPVIDKNRKIQALRAQQAIL
jgi:hypothetical protein